VTNVRPQRTPSLPPAFFVPDASDGGQAEQVCQSVRSCVRGQSPGWTISDRRIYQLDYTYDVQDYRSRDGAVEAVAGESVVAILEATNGAERLFFVCTPNRGGTPGLPVYPGSRQVQTAATSQGRSQRTDCRAAAPCADCPLRGAEDLCPAMDAAAGYQLRGPPDGCPRAACGGRLTARPVRQAR